MDFTKVITEVDGAMERAGVRYALNDPARSEDDWHDIYTLLRAAREQGTTLDWNLLEEYLRIFRLEGKVPELKARYEQQST